MIELSAGHPLAIDRLAIDACGRLLFPRFDHLISYSVPEGVESVVARDIGSPAEFRVAPDSRELLVALPHGLLRFLSAGGPGKLVALPSGCSLFWPMIAPAANIVFSRGRDHPQLVDIAGDRVRDFRRLPPRLPHADALFPEGERLLTVHPVVGSPRHRYRVVVRTTDRELQSIESVGRRINVSRVSPDGRLIALGTGPQIAFWRPQSGRLTAGATEDRTFVRCLAFDAEGARLLVGRSSGAVDVHDAATGRLIQELHRAGSAVSAVAWSPDGTTAAAGTSDGRILLIDARG
jgi:WD40 repeat protein